MLEISIMLIHLNIHWPMPFIKVNRVTGINLRRGKIGSCPKMKKKKKTP